MLLNNKQRNAKNARFVAEHWGKSLSDKKWYAIEDDDVCAEIRIYDVVGWPFIDADTFVSDLNRIKSNNITVAINSPGGDVFDGTAIYNALKNHPAKITTRIDGFAASIASIIALAGDDVQIASNAYFMIHNPWSFSMGDYRDLEKDADLLTRIANTLAEMYAAKTGKNMKEIRTAMDNETWYIGAEAEKFGFADKTIGEKESVTAKFNVEIFNHLPDNIKHENKTVKPTVRDIERVLTRDAGMTRAAARQLIAGGYNVKQDADAVRRDADTLEKSLNLLNNIIRT